MQGWASWFWDWVKGELIGIVIGTLFVWGLYAFLRRSPRRWWFYGWLASIPVVLLLVFIGPIFIAPLFNTFAPLQERQPALVPELEKVIPRGGLPIDRSRMFEMQASDKVTTYNAYVTGIGASKRVVVWDNTSRDLTIPETMFVFGHERATTSCSTSGCRSGWRSSACWCSCISPRACSAACWRGSGGAGACATSTTGRRCRSFCCSSACSRWSLSRRCAFSRYLEHQADIYGLEVIHGLVPDSSQAAAHAFQKLGEKALSYPDPIRCWCSGPTITRRCRPPALRRHLSPLGRRTAGPLHRLRAAGEPPGRVRSPWA